MVVDQVPRDPVFGVRFWDEATGTPVRNELDVVVYPQFNRGLKAKVAQGPTGSYVLGRLPWTPAASILFNVDVDDPAGDFLPTRFAATLPAATQFQLDCASPPIGPYVPLFSTPQRAVPASMAVLRAQLWDLTNDRAAAGGLVEITAGAQIRARGVSDGEGRVSVIFGYPEPVRMPGLSPGTGSGLPLTQQTWDAAIRVFYRAASPDEPRQLCEILQQPVAIAWQTSAATAPLTNTMLRFGRELIVRSADAATLKPLSKLLVTPGA